MVQLEEVEDQELDQAQPGPIPDSAYDSADFTDTNSELSDDDDPTPSAPQETLSDRLLALRDIIPPTTRRTLSSLLTSTTSAAKTGAWWSGKGLWVLSTGFLMLSVPFAIALVEEQQIVEQEKEMKAQESAREVLTPGVGAATGVGEKGRGL